MAASWSCTLRFMILLSIASFLYQSCYSFLSPPSSIIYPSKVKQVSWKPSSKKSVYDKEFDSCTRIDLSTAGDRSYHAGESTVRGEAQNQESMQNLEFRKENQRPRMSTFWTACPYCYMLFEYPRIYAGCCLRCQNCDRAFHGALIQTVPPLIPKKEAYYCTWAFFSLLSGGQETEVEPLPGFPDKR
ncbi:hypothetical protein J1N35_041894 [Gossypium stocksii]|uniref:Zinc beta-ribbon domain-containing protein n=1 Tax=Gossypium stocksii TaxID=47602 RepID=A0A9D3ZJU8_9ROSI|nr:hypothetical protein J1N35_041894 [Gossypium stocksii]